MAGAARAKTPAPATFAMMGRPANDEPDASRFPMDKHRGRRVYCAPPHRGNIVAPIVTSNIVVHSRCNFAGLGYHEAGFD
jgi:hypothetical protein